MVNSVLVVRRESMMASGALVLRQTNRRAEIAPVWRISTKSRPYNLRMDTLTPEQRSERMARIKGRDTKPELAVRRLLHSRGYRYRLHDKRLPGTPDLVFARTRKVVFVHGCFWHMHEGCALARMPKSRLEFWKPKLESNRARDQRKLAALSKLGWDAMIVWECELRDLNALANKLEEFLQYGHKEK